MSGERVLTGVYIRQVTERSTIQSSSADTCTLTHATGLNIHDPRQLVYQLSPTSYRDVDKSTFRTRVELIVLRPSQDQCRINHVADVANATGLGPQGASGSI